jgi:hypothetical protein
MSTEEIQEVLAERNLVELESQPSVVHNFDGDKMRVWSLLSYATGPSCHRGEECLNKPLALRNWLVHLVHIAKEDGTVVQCLRTVLVDNKGECYGFVSDGVFTSLRMLISTLGKGPYDPPIGVIVRQQSVSGGKRFYVIEPQGDGQGARKSKEK